MRHCATGNSHNWQPSIFARPRNTRQKRPARRNRKLTAEGWLENNTVREGKHPISDGRSTLNFKDLPYGEYAISVYQDKNDNGKLDTGLFGIPKEPFGFSNDPKMGFGPPKYKDSAFTLQAPETTIQISVKKLF